MHIAYIVVAAVFTVMLTMSARMKLVHDPLAVEVIGGVVGFRCASSPSSRCSRSQAVSACWPVSVSSRSA
jgi:hypothetical protein